MKDKEMTYEQAVKRLEEIVRLLERNELPLEEALSLFEEGTRLTTYCTKLLNEAKQIITDAEKE